MKVEINLNDFIREFKDSDRDCYSYEGYQKIFNYYEEFEDFDFDVIAVCCDVSEYTEEELLKDYSYLIGDFKKWVEYNKDIYTTEEEQKEEFLNELLQEMEKHTTIIKLENDNFLVWNF